MKIVVTKKDIMLRDCIGRGEGDQETSARELEAKAREAKAKAREDDTQTK